MLFYYYLLTIFCSVYNNKKLINILPKYSPAEAYKSKGKTHYNGKIANGGMDYIKKM